MPQPAVGERQPWMTEPPSGPERLGRAIRARRWTFLFILIAIPAAALLLSLSQGKDYTASSALLVRTPGAGGEPGDQARTVETTKDMLRLDTVARRASRALGNVSPSDVSDAVDVTSGDRSNLIEVQATADSAGEAENIADAYARSFVALKRQADRTDYDAAIARLRGELESLTPDERAGDGGRTLQARLEELRAARSLSQTSVDPVQNAEGTAEAHSRHVVRNTALGLLAGLLLATLIAWLLERLDRRVRTVEALEEIYELPILSRIPRSRELGSKRAARQRPDENVVTKASGFSEEAEAFRILRANLRYFNVDRDVRSLLIASPLSGDGKSTVAHFLAMTMAAMGDRVVLVDADLRKPDPMASRAEQQAEGLSLVLAGFDLDDALTEIPVAFNPISEESRSVFKLPSGPLPPNPSELLDSARMRWVIHELEQRFDAVIIDSPALAVVSDALALVPQVSGIIIVSGFKQTTRHSALAFRKQIAMLGGRSLGLVANFWKPEGGDDRYYYKYESYTPAGRR